MIFQGEGVPLRIETRLTRDYRVDHPIVSAGLAFVGTSPELAIAVCNAGGVGSIAAGPLPGEAIRRLIRTVRAATAKTFHVNLITCLAQPEQVDVCIEERAPIVSFHWGHPPGSFVEQLHDAGIKVWEQVGSVAAAEQAVELGVDLIIAQGTEAGGHNFGSLPTFVVLPAIVEAVAPTPVLAAGGIVSGRQLAAALVLGAEGAWIGTRFVASCEAFAHDAYKQRLIEGDGTQTRLTSVFGPDLPHFNPMRVLDVGLAREFAGRESDAPTDLEQQPVIGSMEVFGRKTPLRRFSSFVPTPATVGAIDQMPFLAGQGVGGVREILPVSEIVETLVSEATEALVVARAAVDAAPHAVQQGDAADGGSRHS
jgi:NAD(P)H-dependent flavin oxidoreductase YrpB (nitropropane dioxygenase family)